MATEPEMWQGRRVFSYYKGSGGKSFGSKCSKFRAPFEGTEDEGIGADVLEQRFPTFGRALLP